MKINRLNESEHIALMGENAYSLYLFDEYFHYYLLRYKICEFDVVGALEAGQIDAAYISGKHYLRYGICIHLYIKGFSPSKSDYYMLEQLREALADKNELLGGIIKLFFSNAVTYKEMEDELKSIRAINEEELIPSDILSLWGETKRFNFSAYLDSVLTVKDVYSKIKNMHEKKPTYSAETVREMRAFQYQVTKGK